MTAGRESSGKGALTPVTRAGGLHPRQSLPVALSPAFCCMLSSTAAGCSAGGRWPGTRPGWADCEALEHGVGRALARVSRGARADEGTVAKELAGSPLLDQRGEALQKDGHHRRVKVRADRRGLQVHLVLHAHRGLLGRRRLRKATEKAFVVRRQAVTLVRRGKGASPHSSRLARARRTSA